jgi:hypothetical protein
MPARAPVTNLWQGRPQGKAASVGEVTSSHILNGMKADAFTQKTKSP